MEEDNFYISSEKLIKPTEKQQEKAQADKNDSITEMKDPTKFMIEVNTNKQVCAILRRSLNGLEAKVKKFDKPKK